MRISDWSSDVCSSDPRFLVLGKQEPGQSGDDITSVVMTAHRNQPGALFKLLQPFAESGLDLTRLESREIRNSVVTDYYFFVDFAGHAADPKVRAVLETIRRSEEHTSELQSLMRISYAVFCLKNKKNNYTVTKQSIIRRTA